MITFIALTLTTAQALAALWNHSGERAALQRAKEDADQADCDAYLAAMRGAGRAR